MSIIQVENISKRYIISHKSGQRSKYNSLGETITNKMKGILPSTKNHKQNSKNQKEEFWALKDISFEVNPGDKIGIIGRNGAGKSTLLKILSRITEPTEGKVKIKGRIASLLEVGTGFHPELTGRENIFLNGAILGMKKEEIKKKFDEIVAFSEIEKFLDTPVKRYSSGMYVRLAFAVAAHLEPEILLVDEVLAVGDYEFQKKCIGKMEEVSNEGRTVIFVSHNLSIIENLCPKAILLEKGEIYKAGNVDTIINSYTKKLKGNNYKILKNNNKFKFNRILNQLEGRTYTANENIELKIEIERLDKDISEVNFDFAISNDKDEMIIHSKSNYIKEPFKISEAKIFYVNYIIKSPKLKSGFYYLTIYLHRKGIVELWVEKIEAFKILPTPYFGIIDYFEDLKSPIIPEFDIFLS